jgi:hypothetical protein
MGLEMLPRWACPLWWPWRWETSDQFDMIFHPVFLPKRDAVVVSWEWCVDLKRGWGWLFYFPHLLYLLTYLPVTCRWSFELYSRRGTR